ncbi:hypothetical protein K432DRAFT_386750 [Lepidopterella palustris CBS 459.81]|uniref:Uncharacterized protein n=1 Tax=Lepidopterella palustris CBS 459.81 TaxID=1314670 RepID=A0A8E2DZG6_9PEZI|nr:hypothetical protein K432DRAFT_386750 [Lepidopterella palustris CBS 459.81]
MHSSDMEHSTYWPSPSSEPIYSIQTVMPTSISSGFVTCMGMMHEGECRTDSSDWDSATSDWGHSYTKSDMRSYMWSYSRCDEVCTGTICTNCWLSSPTTDWSSSTLSVTPSATFASSAVVSVVGATTNNVSSVLSTTAKISPSSTSVAAAPVSTGLACKVRISVWGAVLGAVLTALSCTI